jgi:hypothetical protein
VSLSADLGYVLLPRGSTINVSAQPEGGEPMSEPENSAPTGPWQPAQFSLPTKVAAGSASPIRIEGVLAAM